MVDNVIQICDAFIFPESFGVGDWDHFDFVKYASVLYFLLSLRRNGLVAWEEVECGDNSMGDGL